MLALRNITRVTSRGLFPTNICSPSLRHASVSNKQRTGNDRFERNPVPFRVANKILTFMKRRSIMADMNKTLNATSMNTVTEKEWNSEIQDLKKTLSGGHGVEKGFSTRISDIGLDKSLQVADLYVSHNYMEVMFLPRLFDYALHADFSAYPPKTVVHLMYFVYFHGRAPSMLFKKVEDYLSNNLELLHINDIGLICLGFFRGNVRILSYELLDRISQRLVDQLEFVEKNMLINITKVLSHSSFFKFSFFQNFADKILTVSFIETTINPSVLMHIASFYASASVYHKPLTQSLMSAFVRLCTHSDLKVKPRSKDIAQFVKAMGMLCHEPVSEKMTYMKLVEAYKRFEEERTHPESLADMLHGLSYLGILPTDMLDMLFHPEKVNLLKGPRRSKELQLRLVSNIVLIECPDYAGLQQAWNVAQEFNAQGWRNFQQEINIRRGFKEIHKSLANMLGADRVKADYILPHYRSANIELRLDASNHPIKTGDYDNQDPWNVQPLDTKHGSEPSVTQHKIAIELGSIRQFLSSDSLSLDATTLKGLPVTSSNQAHHVKLNGHNQTKMRNLNQLGYKVIMLHPHEVNELADMKEDERRRVLCERLHKETGMDVQVCQMES
ncbi:FAST kinase domain-containing protein 5, mitochondrial-like [Haliotis rubra]|uniref:FAST kinase domain-containing protein 5, mitochondrial-like n=1 Tax=Haliotis rubra TaxID=36100 RepID=UPI001EE5D305|nr:FAST kinase domain-containing protein 5, mitochondrial-like [Haliotis rubra]XP_046559956.1 FAST kinase domain-containing protein 5, mitochondrial-like [Haliotis rubra]XP_046559957.1 FAST kinase domain-containing protein 5, mitochondrial-like [Haliotis rubra]